MSGEREIAAEPMLVEQDVLPAAGLFLDRHQVPVPAGDPMPVDGEQVAALCGALVVIGPPPAEVLLGIPATHTADCLDCRAVIIGVDTAPMTEDDAEPVARAYVRRPGTVPVHVIELGPAAEPPAALIARCGQVFHVGDPVDHLRPGDGAPCTLCLLRTSSSPFGRSAVCSADATEDGTTPEPTTAIRRRERRMSVTRPTDVPVLSGPPAHGSTSDGTRSTPAAITRAGAASPPPIAPGTAKPAGPPVPPVPLDVAVGAGTVAAEPWVMWETLIAAVQRWTVQPADALRNNHGITVYDYRLLRLLARAPRPMRKAITNTALDLPPRSLDHSVTRLADRGYLTVTGRGNEKRLALTDPGIAFLEEVIDTLRTATADSLPATALAPRDRTILVTLLNRLRR
ncbi:MULTISPECIES: MarR family winged helix-turn-helix transcriptional regulator [Actinoalloteichus]|uniref:Uncharacterized protein n=1 Tax=Actinoalloteichus fjordicus TaxID=1612552 RepID=A0AAC9PTN5_9PSEU|nr:MULTISPECIES: hypothetical protein [Actinoalloteichus]APU16071.1 hypothetical protein UA74_20230 [Actinoalloteichus fjordicus]APU22136.1 hypothetical protein UA75_20735 [Actinoalloteichus sp. GBA129-24]